jgi:hypothetical protein
VISKAPIQKSDKLISLAGFSSALLELLFPNVKLPPLIETILILWVDPGIRMSSDKGLLVCARKDKVKIKKDARMAITIFFKADDLMQF